jgi:hypothetical protein
MGAGGYEYHVKNQKDQVEQDHKDGKIDQNERDIRIDQIQGDSLLQSGKDYRPFISSRVG